MIWRLLSRFRLLVPNLEEKNDAVEDMEEAAPEEEEEEEEEEYVVEKIIKHRQTRKGKLEYFVKWEGNIDFMIIK